jgi:hypothetical protein
MAAFELLHRHWEGAIFRREYGLLRGLNPGSSVIT